MKSTSAFFIAVLSLLVIISLQSYSRDYTGYNITDSTQNELNGEIQSKRGNTIKVTITSSETLPDIGATGILSKYFEEEILGMNTHGYIDIGEVEVINITESEVTFTLKKELSKMTMNGKKKDHFKKGNIVRFIW